MPVAPALVSASTTKESEHTMIVDSTNVASVDIDASTRDAMAIDSVEASPSAPVAIDGAVAVAPEASGEAPTSALVPFKPKRAKISVFTAMKKKVLAEIWDKDVPAAIQEVKEEIQATAAKISELKQAEQVKNSEFFAARDALNDARATIQTAIEEEVQATGKVREAKEKRKSAADELACKRRKLFENARKVALYEVVATREELLQKLEESRKEVARLNQAVADETKNALQKEEEHFKKRGIEVGNSEEVADNDAGVEPRTADKAEQVATPDQPDAASAQPDASAAADKAEHVLALEKLDAAPAQPDASEAQQEDDAAQHEEAEAAQQEENSGQQDAVEDGKEDAVEEENEDAEQEENDEEEEDVPNFEGEWKHSNGSTITITLEDDTLVIDSPIAGKRSVLLSEFVTEGGLSYCNLQGSMDGDIISWSNGATWTREVA